VRPNFGAWLYPLCWFQGLFARIALTTKSTSHSETGGMRSYSGIQFGGAEPAVKKGGVEVKLPEVKEVSE
jgi:hypothetical protein